MFSSLKIGLVLVMLAGAGGGYLYINKLQKDNATLKTNQIKLESAVEDNNKVIEQQIEDINKIRKTLEIVEHHEKLTNLNQQKKGGNIIEFKDKKKFKKKSFKKKKFFKKAK